MVIKCYNIWLTIFQRTCVTDTHTPMLPARPLCAESDLSKVKDLIETAARHTHDRTDVVIRVRNLRAIKALPADGRKHSGPQIETVHVVSLVLALLKAGPQVDAAEAVRDLWTLPGYITTHPRNEAGVLPVASYFTGTYQTFGQFLASFVEVGASSDPDQRASLPSLFSSVNASRDYAFAQIHLPGGHIHYFQRDGYNPALAGVMSTATGTDPATIGDFADLVRHSRVEALRLGTTIPVEDAYRALGLLPPGSPGSPANVPGIDKSGFNSTTPDTTTAEELAGSSAVAGQTASPLPCPRDCGHGSETQTHTQDAHVSERPDPFVSGDVTVSACDGDTASGNKEKDASYDRTVPYLDCRAAA